MVIDRSTIPLEMLGEPDDTECPHGIPTGMGVECWECRYEQLNQDHVALEDDYAALEQRVKELEAELEKERYLHQLDHSLADQWQHENERLKAELATLRELREFDNVAIEKIQWKLNTIIEMIGR